MRRFPLTEELRVPRPFIEALIQEHRRTCREAVAIMPSRREDGRLVVVDCIILREGERGALGFRLKAEELVKVLLYCKKHRLAPVLAHTHECGCSPSAIDLENMMGWPAPWVIVDVNAFEAKAWLKGREVKIVLT